MADGSTAWVLNFRVVPMCLLVVALFALTLHTMFSPINCHCPAEFTKSMVDAAKSQCWQQRTYFPVYLDIIPSNEYNKMKMMQGIYQYVPLLLVIQIVFFLIPLMVWKSGMSLVGIRLGTLYQLADGYTKQTRAERRATAQHLAAYVKQWIEQSLLGGCCWGFITLLLLFVKLFTLINIITQFSIVNGFLKAENETSYGHQLSRNLWTRNEILWKESPAFPRNIICDFSVRRLSHNQHFTVQCSLAVNVYQEQMYAAVWILLSVTLAVTLGDFITHIINNVIPMIRTRFVRRHLQVHIRHFTETRLPITDTEISSFTSSLGQDGVTILQHIASTSSDLVVSDVIGELWTQYKTSTSPQQGMIFHHNQQQPVSLPPPPFNQTVNQGYHVPPPAVYPPPSNQLPNYYEARTVPEQIPLMEQGGS